MNPSSLLRSLRSLPWWVWAVPAVLVVVNLGALIYYQIGYAGQFGQMQGQLDSAKNERSLVMAQRQALEELVGRANTGREGIESLYVDSFSTESERLTRMIREVKDLAEKAGLQPAETISYPEESIDDYGLLKRSLVFTVNGTYPQLRQFVNFLELSDTFVVLEKVNVSGVSPSLAVSFDISTLFSGRDSAEERIDRRRRRRNA
ncbi:MAG: hypothetical protein AAGK22_15525 [Acidobacteriota bacterium]